MSAFARLASGTILAVVACVTCAAMPAKAALYGLVVGVDAYTGTGRLNGAVNDATDIAAVLTDAGAARVDLIIDEEARRPRVIAAWTTILEEATRGDVVVFSFAGHGAQEPDLYGVRDEPDGFDEVFLLQGFSEDDDSGFADKIVDDELYEWAKQAERRGVTVIFVFDTCHSGIPVRSIDPRVSSGDEVFRFTRYSTRPTAPVHVEDTGTLARLDFGNNIVALGATDEAFRVREQKIAGQVRGILSWAFARAIEGAADRNGDRVIAAGELADYVRTTVLDRARHRQVPQIFAPNANTRLLAVSAVGGEPATVAIAALPDVSLFTTVAGLTDAGNGATLVADRAHADLVFDVEKGDLIDAAGDVLASNLDPGTLKAAVDAQRLRRAIGGLVSSGKGLDVSLRPGNGVHCEGRVLSIHGSSSSHAHYTAFNVTGRGRIQFLWPLTRFNDPVRITAGQEWSFVTKVGPPFGSDSVVLIASSAPFSTLHAVLEGSADELDPPDLWRILAEALVITPHEIAVQDIFTRAGSQGSGPCS